MRTSLACLLLVSLALGACAGSDHADGSDRAVDARPEAGFEYSTGVRVIEGLRHVETSAFALGSVWAVTSNRPDRFSREPIEATVTRIDATSGLAEKVLDSPGFEPTFSELDGKLWVRLVDRVVALDATGSQVSSIEFDPSALGDLIAGTSHLWLLNFDGGEVSVIDPSTAAVVRTIETGDFPVSPTAAFGQVWIPSSIDGTVTIIDEETLGDTRILSSFVSDQQLEDVTAVPGGMTGDEVWVTTRNGEVFAITAHGESLGDVRQVKIDNPINRIHIHADRAFLLPISGRDVLVINLITEDLIARIPTDSIAFRAAVAHDLVWVSGDGMAETLSVIDPVSLTMRAQFPIGSNQSNTNGPHNPFAVGDEIWVPNRGDSAFFIIDIAAVPDS